MGSPIRVPPGRRMCAPRRGLSRLAAPFVGSLCQGIRRAPVVSWPRARRGPTSYQRLLISSLEHVSCMLMNSALIRFNGFRIPRHVLGHARDQMLLLRIRSCFFLLDRIIAMQYLSQKRESLNGHHQMVTLSSLCGSQGTRGEPLGPGAAEGGDGRTADGHAADGSRVKVNLDEVFSLERR